MIFYQNMPNLHNRSKSAERKKFNSILHVVSEKKIFKISANQRLVWPLAAILDNRLEQKVTTIDQNLVRNISAKYGSNPFSGS